MNVFIGLLTLVMVIPSVSWGAEKPLFDFGSLAAGERWRVVNDDVMGGVSRSAFVVADGEGVFSGNLSLENNGGFASVRGQVDAGDLAGCDRVVMRVFGDGQRYKFTIRTDNRFDGVNYQLSFQTQKDVWGEIILSFKEFAPTWRGRTLNDVPPIDPNKVSSVGLLISDKQTGPFRLGIAWIKGLVADDQGTEAAPGGD